MEHLLQAPTAGSFPIINEDRLMPQKFMLIGISGYVIFASVASILLASTNTVNSARRFSIILFHWAAILIFVIASFVDTLQIALPTATVALWPIPPSLALSLLAAVAVSLVYGHPGLTGWWSPLPWIRGVIGISLVAAIAGAAQGAGHAQLPDWRFIGTSLVLWAVCLILADLALLTSRSGTSMDTSSRMVRELLRLCAALPALLVYLIGIRL